jgi:hypothetical protein
MKKPNTPDEASPPLDPFEEGAWFAVKVLVDVLSEQRDATFIVERMMRDAPEEKKQAIADVLRPLSVQQSAGETIYTRVEQRVGMHLRERWRAARNAGKATP